jgi:hypothetical protein
MLTYKCNQLCRVPPQTFACGKQVEQQEPQKKERQAHMNLKELFALFLRMVGVLGIIIIVRHALASVAIETVPVFVIVKWVIGVLVGLYFIRGAPLLVKFAFPAST